MKKIIVTTLSIIFLFTACTTYTVKRDPEINQIKKQLAATNRKIDDLARRLSLILARLDKHGASISTLEANLVTARRKTVASADTRRHASDAGMVSSTDKSAGRLYKQALAAYHRKDYDAALSGFQALRTTFPNHPLSKKAISWTNYIERISQPRTTPDDGAIAGQYKQAVTAFNQNDHAGALSLFTTFVRAHPEHPLADKSRSWIRYLESSTKRKAAAIQPAASPRKTKKPDQSAVHKQAGDAAENLYRKARMTYRKHRYAEALSIFQSLVDKYPRHRLADNAKYWVGECLYAGRDYYGAVLAFKDVVKNYPRGNKVPDALLKTGYAYMALQDPRNARQYFEQVAADYPSSKAAAQARNKLKSLAPSEKKRPTPQPEPPQNKMQVHLVTQ